MKECVKSKRVNVNRDLVLDFIRAKNGRAFVMSECAEETGLHYNTVCRMFKRLKAENRVRVVGFKTYEVVEN